MAESSDASRCPLCSASNDCAVAEAAPGEPAGPCWCMERSFPGLLIERANASDGGAACICAGCLERASEEKNGSA